MRTIIIALACLVFAQTAVAQPPSIGQSNLPPISVSAASTGGGTGTPCTTTGSSVQYNASGSFGCVSGVTSDGTSLTFASDITMNNTQGIKPASGTFYLGSSNLTVGTTGILQSITNAGLANMSAFDSSASGTLHLASGSVFCWNNANAATAAAPGTCDTGLSRAAAASVKVNNGTTGYGTLDTGAVNKVNGVATRFNVASDFTTSGVGTALETITGLTWTLPATTVLSVPFRCDLLYTQGTGNATVAFGVQTASVTPTNFRSWGVQQTNASITVPGNVAIANTTATAVVSGTPSDTTSIWSAYVAGYLENPSNASTTAVNIMVSTATAGDTVTIKRGSFCTVF